MPLTVTYGSRFQGKIDKVVVKFRPPVFFREVNPLAKQLAKAGNINRQGPVRYVVHDTPDGQPRMLTLGVAYDEAPVPEHYYVADYYQVIISDFSVLLIFGKLDHPQLGRLRNKIEIYFPVENFVRQLWNTSRTFQTSLENYVATNKAKPVEPSTVSAETDKVQTLQSNNALMVQATGDCIIDFFYISPKDLWLKPIKSEPIGMEALVRVMVTASVMLGFLHECDKAARELIDKLEIKLEDHDATLESKLS